MRSRPSRSVDAAPRRLALAAALVLFGALRAGSQPDEAEERSFADIERIAARSEEIVEGRRADFDRLKVIRTAYPGGWNAGALIEERNRIVPLIEAANGELDELRAEFEDYSRSIQMRMLMSGLNSMMSDNSEGLAVAGLSRYMNLKGRMHAVHSFTRESRQFLIEERPEFIAFERAHRQKRRAIAAAAAAGLFVMGATGVWLYRRRRPRALPPPPPAA